MRRFLAALACSLCLAAPLLAHLLRKEGHDVQMPVDVGLLREPVEGGVHVEQEILVVAHCELPEFNYGWACFL